MTIAMKEAGRPAKVKRPPVEELAALYQINTSKELAEHYGVNENTVKGWIYYYRHKAPQKEGA